MVTPFSLETHIYNKTVKMGVFNTDSNALRFLNYESRRKTYVKIKLFWKIPFGLSQQMLGN